MQKLLSLPENLVSAFHRITGNNPENWFVTSDPGGSRIGSGGGTAWLVTEHKRQGKYRSMREYLGTDKRIIIHAGGQSRRLPAYAPSGKILAPPLGGNGRFFVQFHISHIQVWGISFFLLDS